MLQAGDAPSGMIHPSARWSPFPAQNFIEFALLRSAAWEKVGGMGEGRAKQSILLPRLYDLHAVSTWAVPFAIIVCNYRMLGSGFGPIRAALVMI